MVGIGTRRPLCPGNLCPEVLASLVKPNRSPGGVRLSDWSYSVTPVVLGISLQSIIARKAILCPESCTPGPLHACVEPRTTKCCPSRALARRSINRATQRCRTSLDLRQPYVAPPRRPLCSANLCPVVRLSTHISHRRVALRCHILRAIAFLLFQKCLITRQF